MSRALGPGKLIKAKRSGGDAQWILDWKDAAGTRRRQVLGGDKRMAERLRADIIHKRDLELSGLASVAGQEKRLSELRDAYTPDLKARTSLSHHQSVTSIINKIIEALRDPKVRDLRAQDLIAIRLRRVAQGAAHNTVNKAMQSFLGMLRWCARNGVVPQNPVAQLAPLPVDRGHIRRRRRALSDEEVERFLQAAHEDDQYVEDRIAAVRTITNGTKGVTWNSRKRGRVRVPQAAMWRALIETGARIGEIRRIEWADVDLAKQLITLRAATTKSGRLRVIPIRRALVDEIVALRAIHERVLSRQPTPTDKVFLSPQGVEWQVSAKGVLRNHRRLLARAGIAARDAQGHIVDVHSLRHTAASRFARSGVPITTTARILGHSDIQLTNRYYTHVAIDDLRAAVERVPASTAARTRPA